MAKGHIYFAWVDASENTFAATVHAREDEQVASLAVEQREGDFATLKIEIKNPKIGLLNPARKQYCWLSWDNGTAIVPLFHGRLVGVPELVAEMATIEFLAAPVDFIAQKAALASTLRAAPFWDDVFVMPDKRGDPDSVLEARTALWHIDRVTGVVSISDVISGEDGTETFTASEVPYDSLKVSMAQQPLMSLTVDAQVSWNQQDSTGGLPFGPKYRINVRTITGESIFNNWPKAGASFSHGWGCGASAINSTFEQEKALLTSGSIKSPKPDFSNEDPFGLFAEVSDMFGPEDQNFTESEATWTNIFPKDQNPGGWLMIPQVSITSMEVDKSASVSDSGYYVPAETLNGWMQFSYDASRQRTEHVQFTLTADVQAVQSTTNQLPVESIALGGAPVDAAIDEIFKFTYTGTIAAGDQISAVILLRNGKIVQIDYIAHTADTIATALAALAALVNSNTTLLIDNSGVDATANANTITFTAASGQISVTMQQPSHLLAVRNGVLEPIPIGYVGRSSYFCTPAGLASIEYLLMVARARLAVRARAVDIEVDLPFEHAVLLSCRKNGIVVDPRLPSGQAAGKVSQYSFSVSGDNGQLIGKVRVSCCIGHGGSLSPAAGTPDYVNVGYVDTGYQDYTGDLTLVGAGDVGYSVPAYLPNDDGIFFPLNAPIFIAQPTYHSNPPDIGGDMSPAAASALAKKVHDTYTFTLQPLDTGPFSCAFLLETSVLVLPKGIDLESA